jgi:16S rRNA (cytosine967-C5)-methyltransferase
VNTATARAVAVEALIRVEDGAYANLVVPSLLDRTRFTERDRAFVTELAYGTTRMQRACDWLIAPALDRPIAKLDIGVRAALRLGAFQLAFLRTPPHAAVSATVDAAPPRASGLVNAVLRKVATATSAGDPAWPDDATRLSYPDWIVARLADDLGSEAALAALEKMNRPASVHVREDGYVQDEASEQVAAYVAAQPAGSPTLDLCAAPGGKATAIAEAGPDGFVVASDIHPSRTGLIVDNVSRLDLGNLAVVRADAKRPPYRPGSAGRILIDAPCSGLGVLRRRPDARWRITAGDVDELAALQRDLLAAAMPLLRPGGSVIYSVCTLTAAETVEIDAWLAASHPEWETLEPPGPPWDRAGRGARLLPQAIGSDGMFVLGLRAPG